MFLLEGAAVPDHATFARFRSLHFAVCSKRIFAESANFLYQLGENAQLSFIKPANYEISKTRKYLNDISRVENMEYHEDSDYYVCKNGKKLVFTGIKKDKSKTGYVLEKSLYSCEDCTDCPYKEKCIRGNNCKTPLEERTKHLQVSGVSFVDGHRM